MQQGQALKDRLMLAAVEAPGRWLPQGLLLLGLAAGYSRSGAISKSSSQMLWQSLLL